MNLDLALAAHELLLSQRREWPMLEKGYASLETVKTRPVPVEGVEILLQFNPGRMASAAAKVDPKSIRERRCFLCEANLPAEQRGLAFGEDYLILCNPFPIFPEHFTIPHRQHRPQEIAGSFGTMLELARELADRYVVFYNGPKCGASAPDHLHFQAGTKDFLPLVQEYDRLKAGFAALSDSAKLRVFASRGYPARFIALESSDANESQRGFDAAYRALQRITGVTEEPLLNILMSYDAGAGRTLIFPRAKHRPSCYFAEGDQKILITPASVEMAGVCALPVERDFQRLRSDDLLKVYQEVSFPHAQFGEWCAALRTTLN